MPDIRFSVVIPAYNAAATIVPTVQSCLGQTIPPHQVIVVDDGSTDGTAALLQEHFGEHIQLILLTRNTGPGGARNEGLAKVTGTHVAFQDADDTWHPEKLRLIAGLIESRPEVRFLYHPYTLASLDYDVTKYQPVLERYSFLKLLGSNPIGTPCVVMRYHEGLFFDARMHHMEDYDLWLREGYAYGIYLLPIPLTRVNRPILSAGGQSGARWKMRQGEFRAYWHLTRIHPLFGLLLPFLVVLGLLKHVVKSFRPVRTNY